MLVSISQNDQTDYLLPFLSERVKYLSTCTRGVCVCVEGWGGGGGGGRRWKDSVFVDLQFGLQSESSGQVPTNSHPNNFKRPHLTVLIPALVSSSVWTTRTLDTTVWATCTLDSVGYSYARQRGFPERSIWQEADKSCRAFDRDGPLDIRR